LQSLLDYGCNPYWIGVSILTGIELQSLLELVAILAGVARPALRRYFTGKLPFFLSPNGNYGYIYAMRTKDDNYEPKYEPQEVAAMILTVLADHPGGMFEEELIDALPKDISEEEIQTFLLLLIDKGAVLLDPHYRLNENENHKSPFAGLLDIAVKEQKEKQKARKKK